MTTSMTRTCFQLGKFENVSWMPPLATWRTTHSSPRKLGPRAEAEAVTAEAVTEEEVSTSGGNGKFDRVDVWEPPRIERLYEDDLIIAISKPGTLLVHNNKGAMLLEKQRKAFAKNLVEAQLTHGRKVSPVHRLDRAASGVMIFSKTSDATRAAQFALSHPASIKEYVVLARGSTPDFFVCDEPVNDDKGIPRSAISECTKILDLPDARCSLLKVVIKTGRWHQIRKHLNHRAHHVVGDVQHGKGGTNRFFRENYKMNSGRIFLHAHRLTFPHPLHISRAPWTAGPRKLSDDIEEVTDSTHDLESDSSSSDLENVIKMPDDRNIWMAPNTCVSDDPNCRHQLLTIRAALPHDLQQVLYSIPENLSEQNLLSLGIIF